MARETWKQDTNYVIMVMVKVCFVLPFKLAESSVVDVSSADQFDIIMTTTTTTTTRTIFFFVLYASHQHHRAIIAHPPLPLLLPLSPPSLSSSFACVFSTEMKINGKLTEVKDRKWWTQRTKSVDACMMLFVPIFKRVRQFYCFCLIHSLTHTNTRTRSRFNFKFSCENWIPSHDAVAAAAAVAAIIIHVYLIETFLQYLFFFGLLSAVFTTM